MAWSLLIGRSRGLPEKRRNISGGNYFGGFSSSGLWGQGFAEERTNIANISYAQVCISILSQSIRSVPLGVYQLNEGARRGAGLKRMVDHPVDRVLQFPSANLSRQDTIDVVSRRLLEYANSFLIIRRDGKGNVEGLETTGYEINASAVINETPLDTDGGQYRVLYSYGNVRRNEEGLDPKEICHFKMWPDEQSGGVIGKPPQERQQNLFRSASFYDKYISDTLGKSPAFILKEKRLMETSTEGVEDGSETRRKEIMTATSNSPIVSLSSEEDIKPLNNSAEVQSLGVSNFLLLGMSRAYGVPVGYLQTDEKQGVNPIELQTAQLAAQGLRWLTSSIESELTLKLLNDKERRSGLRVLFELSSFSQTSYQTKLTTAIQGSTNGVLTINEAREVLGVARLEGEEYNKLYINKAQQSVDGKEGVGEQGKPGVPNQAATDYQQGGGDKADIDTEKNGVGYKKAKI